MHLRNLRCLILLPTALVALALLAPDQLSAQATAVRSRAAELSGFVAYSNTTPDYGGGHNSGITVCADYLKYLPWLSPAIEMRYKTTPGGANAAVGESTFGGGIRVEHQISLFHPYAVVYSYGGGLDYDFAKQWAARVDYQGEHWNLQVTPPIILTPRVLTIGVVYRVRFRRDRGE